MPCINVSHTSRRGCRVSRAARSLCESFSGPILFPVCAVTTFRCAAQWPGAPGGVAAVLIWSVAPICWLSGWPSTPTPAVSIPTSATALRRASLEGTVRLLVGVLGLALAKYPPDDSRTGDPGGLRDADGERCESGNRSAPSLSDPGGGDMVRGPNQARQRCPRWRSALTGPTLSRATLGSGPVS